MKYYVGGFVVTLAVIAFGVFFPSHEKIADALMEPGAMLANAMPGGMMHNPLNLILAVVVQTVCYSFAFRLVDLLHEKFKDFDAGK
jgi:hypothetical protein